jgi:GNAT superfamily N-acetyltransferase
MSNISVLSTELPHILDMREEYRREMNAQIVHDSWHKRGFTTSYLCQLDDTIVGYGAVGGVPPDPKDIVKEFYVQPAHRRFALPLFRELISVSGARRIHAQTNDALLTLMLLDCGTDWTSDAILFADAITTTLPPPDGVTLRPVARDEHGRVFPHTAEPVGEWGLECDGGQIVATAGFLCHYNPPYGDVYMEVDERYRRRGFGSYLVQEVKRLCRERGRVPAARTNIVNVASRRTLERAGMLPCARILRASVK